MYLIKQYKADDYTIWNTFVSDSKNGTFLFHRDFMEYHQDRFEDFSLLIFKDAKLLAVLPANKVNHQIYSHQGLTYGGLVYSDKLRLSTILEIFGEMLQFLDSNNFKQIFIKLIPSIYHTKPAEDLHYILFLVQARLIKRDALSVIDLRESVLLYKNRKEGVRRGINHQLVIKEENNLDIFWNQILIPNLRDKHFANPVHTLQEINMLKSKFPKNIRQFNVYFKDKIVAGTTIFESKNVAHSQYIASSESKNELGSLDFLHHYLITEIFKEKKYFDFGISNENQGQNLNQGLSYWKESFGASTIVQDFYEVETNRFKLLENVVI